MELEEKIILGVLIFTRIRRFLENVLSSDNRSESDCKIQYFFQIIQVEFCWLLSPQSFSFVFQEWNRYEKIDT